MDVQLTDFQRSAERKVRTVLESAGVRLRDRRAMTAQMPWMSRPEAAVKLVADGVEVWIYEDEVTFSTPTEDRRFERPDFPDEDTLLPAMLESLTRDLRLLSGDWNR